MGIWSLAGRWLVIVGLATAGAAARADEPAAGRWDTTSTVTGLTGLIRVPTAHVLRDGNARLTWTPPMRSGDLSIGARCNYAVGVGIVPRGELALTLGSVSHDFDLAAHGKYQLITPSAKRPAVAIGIADVERNGPRESTSFVVATMPLFSDRAAVTLGGALGGNQGVLAGLQWRIGDRVEVQAEYDTMRFNVGALARLGDRAFARVAALSAGTTLTLGYTAPLTYLAPRPLQAAPPTASGATDSATDAMERVRDALATSGLEDIQVTVTHIGDGREMAVAYEDRCHTVNQLDGMPEALRTLAENAPPDTTALAVMLRRRGLVMAEYRIPIEAYRKFADGKMAPAEFARASEITSLPRTNEMRGPQQTTEIANPSIGHTDLVVSPGIRNVVGTEVGAFRIGVLGRVEAVTQLGRGLQAQARWVYPIGGELVAEDARRIRNDRRLLSYAFVPRPGWLAQVVAGRFPGEIDGIVVEALHPIGKRLVLRGIAGQLDADRLDDRLYWLAECWLMIPEWKAQLRLVGGRFLSADTGIGIDLIRSFGAVDIGLGVKDTSTSRLVEVRLSAPLSPRRQPQRPSRLRVRLADYYEHSLRSIIEGVNYLYLENVTARELPIGPDLRDTFLSRYRLLPNSGFWPGQ